VGCGFLIGEVLGLAAVALVAVEPRAAPPDITLAYSGSSFFQRVVAG